MSHFQTSLQNQFNLDAIGPKSLGKYPTTLMYIVDGLIVALSIKWAEPKRVALRAYVGNTWWQARSGDNSSG